MSKRRGAQRKDVLWLIPVFLMIIFLYSNLRITQRVHHSHEDEQEGQLPDLQGVVNEDDHDQDLIQEDRDSFLLAKTNQKTISKPITNHKSMEVDIAAFNFACPRRDIKTAIIIPFHQLDRLPKVLERWNQSRFSPCDESGSSKAYDVDLIFYSYGSRSEGVTLQEVITRSVQPFLRCFGSLRFFYGNLQPSNVKSRAASAQFYQVFDIIEEPNGPAYDYFFYMELDTSPIRPNWVSRIYWEAACGEDFWVKGSQFYSMGTTDWYRKYGYHINGNAMYNSHDPTWRTLRNEIRKTSGLYDTDLWRWFYPPATQSHFDTKSRREYAHMYRLSNFIVNNGRIPYNVSTYLAMDPTIQFVHGRAGNDEF
eukprot:TRINITY_DN12557_c0_g1_i1.p1 TRINITY_DN12557_c0_g1~~TRINITY_DN12557_c0_g1_i1.p1  ORF type:complete len:366 (+),score=56.67 TRINITY_DN12557_c0_g1_i1:30-1127(+)